MPLVNTSAAALAVIEDVGVACLVRLDPVPVVLIVLVVLEEEELRLDKN